MDIIRRFLRKTNDYFRYNGEEIRQRNAEMLHRSCILYAVVLAVYTTYTVLTTDLTAYIWFYAVFDTLHLLLCIPVFVKGRKPGNYLRTEICHVILDLLVLSDFLAEAVFLFPNSTSIYLPFPILLLVTMFTNRPQRVLCTTTAYVGLFIVLVNIFKAPAVRESDTLIGVATWISAFVGYVLIMSQRFETGSAMLRLRYLSMTDTMTGLHNKQTQESLCQSYMDDQGQCGGYALLFFDIDHFKQINDSLGHPFGDSVLKGIASVMRQSFYDKDYLGRFGGDEFVVFMADIRSAQDVDARLKTLFSKIKQLGESLQMGELSCSAGVAMKVPGETYAELLSRADAALYIAKQSGRRQIVYAERGMLSSLKAAAGHVPLAERRSVLVVDDNEMNRLVLKNILSVEYNVLEACNGQEALDILQTACDTVSAVLLDIIMPVMDGYELMEKIRADARMAFIPLLVTTGYGENDVEERALSLGANDFIIKPYRPEIITQRLRNTIRMREASGLIG